MTVSTGKVLKTYMLANGITISLLAKESGVSPKTIYLILSDEAKLSDRVAIAVEKLIPGLNAAFLVKYDAQYQLAKKKFMSEHGIKNSLETIKYFGIRDIVEEADDQIEMIKTAFDIFGIENVKNMKFDLSDLSPSFSLAKNERYESAVTWVRVAYYEYLNKQTGDLLTFKSEMFERLFPKLKELCKTESFELAISNMKRFCIACGINFYYKKSLRNARVKGVVLKNKEGKLFVFVSDLFKRLDLLWITFIHEMIHIKNHDYNLVSFSEDENEIKVNKEVFDFFNGTEMEKEYKRMLEKNHEIKSIILELAGRHNVSIGITATLMADRFDLYNDKNVTCMFSRIKGMKEDD